MFVGWIIHRLRFRSRKTNKNIYDEFSRSFPSLCELRYSVGRAYKLDSQIHQIKKMGNLKDLASMIPGVGKAIKDMDIDDNAFKSIEAIIYSMTPKERSNPELLNGSRRQRIAAGSGTSIQEVNRLIKQFDQTRKMMRMVTQNKGAMMKGFKRR